MRDDFGELSDVELAEAAKGGDRGARNALFMRHREQVRKLCWAARQITAYQSASAGPITGEDVDQQAFLMFCDLLESWEPERSPFVSYLRQMMPWQALHYVRQTLRYRSKRKVLRLLVPDEEGGEIDPASAEAEHSLAEAESREAWAEQTEGLDPEWRSLIEMRYEQGLSSGEIATLRGQSSRTVNRELRAATDALREKLLDGWEDCG